MAKSSSAHRRDLTLLEELWREPIERYTLPNGLTVLLRRDTAAPVSSVQVWVKTGSIHEGDYLGAGSRITSSTCSSRARPAAPAATSPRPSRRTAATSTPTPPSTAPSI